MSHTKKTERTLIIAILAILLCVVSIAGATYALFTNTSDGTIGINATSGKLEVDIVGIDDDISRVGGVLHFMLKQGEEHVLFEPGAVFYTEGFRVKNRGTITINFLVYISEDVKVPIDFYDAFDVWIAKDPMSDSREMERLTDFNGRLLEGECSDAYHLVFKMKEIADNTFQDKTYTGIGITVCAVQGNVDMNDVGKE